MYFPIPIHTGLACTNVGIEVNDWCGLLSNVSRDKLVLALSID